jgi:CTP:molybdopterin cytidylyltransferase MocA
MGAEAPRLAAILLAAGASRRLGQPKQFVKRNGESLVRRSAGLLVKLAADPIVVVAGFQAERTIHELQDMPLTLVTNQEWEQGMGGSIACGMRVIPPGIDGVLLMLCDLWKLDLRDLQRLKSAWVSDISRIIVSEWNDKKVTVSGPPVIFPGELIHELKCVNGKAGAKAFIDQNREIVRTVTLENAAYDLDGPEDLERFDKP